MGDVVVTVDLFDIIGIIVTVAIIIFVLGAVILYKISEKFSERQLKHWEKAKARKPEKPKDVGVLSDYVFFDEETNTPHLRYDAPPEIQEQFVTFMENIEKLEERKQYFEDMGLRQVTQPEEGKPYSAFLRNNTEDTES